MPNLLAQDGITITTNDGVVQGSMDVNQTVGINKDHKKPKDFLTDLVSWATFFIGTIVTIALIYSALLLIFWWWDEKQIWRAKDGIKYSLIGLLLVIFSYTIVRVIQYVLK